MKHRKTDLRDKQHERPISYGVNQDTKDDQKYVQYLSTVISQHTNFRTSSCLILKLVTHHMRRGTPKRVAFGKLEAETIPGMPKSADSSSMARMCEHARCCSFRRCRSSSSNYRLCWDMRLCFKTECCGLYRQ
jgi:hypothetical protein